MTFIYQYLLPLIISLLLIKYVFCYGIGYLLCGMYLGRLKKKQAYLAAKKNAQVDGPSVVEANSLKIMLLNLINGYIRYSMYQTGKIPSHHLRNFLYRNCFHIKLAPKAVVYTGAEIRGSYQLEIGEGSIIGDQSILDARNGIKIGKHVNLSTGVWIWTEQHDLNSPWFSSEGGPVHIEDRAWISCRVVILPGVTIGEGAVVAAGAVVTKSIEPYAIYGGIPAKRIGTRNPDLVYAFDGSRLSFL